MFIRKQEEAFDVNTDIKQQASREVKAKAKAKGHTLSTLRVSCEPAASNTLNHVHPDLNSIDFDSNPNNSLLCRISI
ncbi:hypothetical protein KQX54_019154 [Cotesia glomerata]|uniref:Uncharacterized protein n=1 Tax=Cotesia glomerata TaxID=32391 RepID=A0AAV7IAZ7_COTGL|nr:hypothetical protein KQX54_019154 [Cotesia glomerata]